MKQFEKVDDDEFLEETLDFRSMLEEAAHVNSGYGSGGRELNENKSQSNRHYLQSEEAGSSELNIDKKDVTTMVPQIQVSLVGYDSSPYDSEECNGSDEEITHFADHPNYDDFLKKKERNTTTSADVDNSVERTSSGNPDSKDVDNTKATSGNG